MVRGDTPPKEPVGLRRNPTAAGVGGAGGRRRSVRSPHLCLLAAMDLRVVLVAAPIVLAASWAVFHIGRAAVGQLQLMLKRARA